MSSTKEPKSSKTSKLSSQNPPTSRSSSLSTHLAMVELKQRIITSLSKLADRDTHQIALEDLNTLTHTISPEALPMLLNSLYDSLSDSSNAKPSIKKESLHLLSLTCQSHRDLTLTHLTKIIAHIVKRLKDSDSSVRDACREAIGVLSGLYLKGSGEGGGVGGGGEGTGGGGAMVGLFVRPLFEAMGEQNKIVQSGAAMCMAKMIDCAAAEAADGGGSNVPIVAFQKMCPRICKLLNGQNFQAKAALLGVVSSLSQVFSHSVNNMQDERASGQISRTCKMSKPIFRPQISRSSSLPTHLADAALKQKILFSLSKLADRDTREVAFNDLHSIMQSLSPGALPVLLNSLCNSVSDPINQPIVKKESLFLLSLCCKFHQHLKLPYLTKIIDLVVKRLKDPDPSIREACCDVVGVLSGLYLKRGGERNYNMRFLVRPLFEAMREQDKGVQLGAAMCVAKMVECSAGDPMPVGAFQKLCPRICKLMNSQMFQAKAALLEVVARLSKVGAIAPQSLESLLQSIHDCLGSTDWATRKAAADVLTALVLHSSNLISDEAANSTLTALEACRFDKIKPARDSMNEALQLWKKFAGKGEDEISNDQKTSSLDGDQPDKSKSLEKNPNPDNQKKESSARDSPSGASQDADSKSKGGRIPDKAVVILKKAPALTDMEINPEFFQKLETRGSGDFPVEVVVPRRCLNSSNSNNGEEPELNGSETREKSGRMGSCQTDELPGSFNKYRNIERGKDLRPRAADDNVNQRESGGRVGLSKPDGQSEGSFGNNKGNWLAIQRQLLLLERQQAHLMNMLQDFMGGSHNSMVTLENRVRGLERVVEDMARDLSISSNRRRSSFAMGYEGPSNRSLGKYNGFSDYSSSKFNGRVPFGERFAQSDFTGTGVRGRGPHWRPDVSEIWDFPSYGASRNGQVGSKRAAASSSADVRSPKSEHEIDQAASRRAWDKGTGPVRLGEGPSARSVWQASKDEATLEAIRVAGEDNGMSRTARVAIPELTAEAMGDDNVGQEGDPVWTSWINAMDALKVGDTDTAYAEVVSTGDDLLLVKLMDRTGPVVEQLSNETACEVFYFVVQFLLDQNLFDICLCWIQQLVEIVLDDGPDALAIPMELKKELLLNLHEASTSMDPPEDWEGAASDQLLLQLASAWGIELRQFDK